MEQRDANFRGSNDKHASVVHIKGKTLTQL